MVKPVSTKQAESSDSRLQQYGVRTSPNTSPSSSSDQNSKYKGVRKRKWGKWVSEIRLPNSRERIWLGSYDSAEKAARAFDAALYCLRGATAKFNFPDNPPHIDNGRSLNPSEIQVAVAQFANSEPQLTRLDNSSSSSSDQLQTESPSSPSVSDGGAVVQLESEIPLDTSFLDQFATMPMGSENINHVPDFGIFPGFDDLSNEFFMQPPLPNMDYGEDNCDEAYSQESFLWNF